MDHAKADLACSSAHEEEMRGDEFTAEIFRDSQRAGPDANRFCRVTSRLVVGQARYVASGASQLAI